MTILFDVTLDISGATKEDQDAAMLIVERENLRREALDPPLPPLPTTPAGALLTSYETVWNLGICPDAHNSYVDQATDFTQAQLGAGYKAAPDSVQDEVDTLLEPFIPTI